MRKCILVWGILLLIGLIGFAIHQGWFFVTGAQFYKSCWEQRAAMDARASGDFKEQKAGNPQQVTLWAQCTPITFSGMVQAGMELGSSATSAPEERQKLASGDWWSKSYRQLHSSRVASCARRHSAVAYLSRQRETYYRRTNERQAMTDKKLPKMLTDQLEGLPQEFIDLIKLDDADNGTRAEKYVAQKQREFVQMLLDDRRRLSELERERAIEVAELRAALAAIKLADRIDDAREIASAALKGKP
jgi:hypothetical protein